MVSSNQLAHQSAQFQNAADTTMMSLLRHKKAPVWVTLMSRHLPEGKRVSGPTLTAAISEDMAFLQEPVNQDTDDISKTGDPDPAQGLLDKWVANKWLYRGPDDKGTVSYQLTSAASQAILVLSGLVERTSMATESALSLVMSELGQMAANSSPDPVVRRNAIQQQIDELVKQRDAIDDGHRPEVDHAALVDRAATMGQVMGRIPADIRHYGELVHAQSAELLRQGLTADADSFASTSSTFFTRIDEITDSPQGQAYEAFATLAGQPDLRDQLVADIDTVLHHVHGLPAHLRRSLDSFLDTVSSCIDDVENTSQTAHRRLRDFFQSGDIGNHRSMHSKITDAQAAAAQAFDHIVAGRNIGFRIAEGGVQFDSIGQYALHDGRLSSPVEMVDSTNEFVVDPNMIRGQEFIDDARLRLAVDTAVADHDGIARLKDVLGYVPDARTGDVFYLWWLASVHGRIDDSSSEYVQVDTDAGVRGVVMPQCVFSSPLPAVSGGAPQPTSIHPQVTLLEGLIDE